MQARTLPTLLVEQTRQCISPVQSPAQFLKPSMEPMKVHTSLLTSLPLGLDFDSALRSVILAKVEAPRCEGTVGANGHAASSSEVALAIEDLLPRAAEVACDAQGRVTFETLLEVATREQCLTITQTLQGCIHHLSMDVQGCRVIQKLLQVLPAEGHLMIAEGLAGDIKTCIESRHGNFVVQACIEQLPLDAIGFIVEAVEKEPKEYAAHKFGCRVIQRLFEHCPMSALSYILEDILNGTVELSKNQYGCHVLRCVLEHSRSEDKLKIFHTMRINILRLSRNRLSASVIEKCLEVASEQANAGLLRDERLALMDAVFTGGTDTETESSETELLTEMVGTRFGRSILRRMIEAASVEERVEALTILRKACPSFRFDNSA